jgi:hypothetical protein
MQSTVHKFYEFHIPQRTFWPLQRSKPLDIRLKCRRLPEVWMVPAKHLSIARSTTDQALELENDDTSKTEVPVSAVEETAEEAAPRVRNLFTNLFTVNSLLSKGTCLLLFLRLPPSEIHSSDVFGKLVSCHRQGIGGRIKRFFLGDKLDKERLKALGLGAVASYGTASTFSCERLARATCIHSRHSPLSHDVPFNSRRT